MSRIILEFFCGGFWETELLRLGIFGDGTFEIGDFGDGRQFQAGVPHADGGSAPAN